MPKLSVYNLIVFVLVMVAMNKVFVGPEKENFDPVPINPQDGFMQTEHPAIWLKITNSWQSLTKMSSGQRNRSKKAIRRVLNHIGGQKLSVIVQKEMEQQNKAERKLNEICIRINRMIIEKKCTRSVKTELLRSLGAVMTYSEFKRRCGGNDMCISSSQYSKLKRGISGDGIRNIYSNKFSDVQITTIRNFWMSDEISRVSPYATHVVKRKSRNNPNGTQAIPIRYRLYTIGESYKKFKLQYPDIKCSRTSFFSHKPKWVKKGKSKLDCCPICKEIKIHKHRLDTMHLNSMEDIQAKHSMEFHQEIVNSRTHDYKNELRNLPNGSCILVMDFKANVSLGKGPEEDSHIFFCAPQRTVFGVAGYFRAGNEIKKINFTVVSPVLMHDSKTVLEILENNILNDNLFYYFNIKKISFWMDNAPNHFRTKELFAGIVHLQERFKVEITMNYFAEYHGKSECDRHFGLISRIYTDHCSYANNNDINTTEDFIQILSDKMRESGNLIPSVGANHTELHSLGSGKLNARISEFMYPNIDLDEAQAAAAELERQQRKNNEKDQKKRKKGKFGIPLPYTRTVINEQGKFTLRNFYKFQFVKDKTGRHEIRGFLKHGSRMVKCKFALVEHYRPDYLVNLGIRTAKERKFKTLNCGFQKFQFHQSMHDN